MKSRTFGILYNFNSGLAGGTQVRTRLKLNLSNVSGPCFKARHTAAQALLDRGFGKPKVEIQNTNTDFRDALAQVGKALDKKRHEEMSTTADIVLTSQ